ncbi:MULTISPECIES: hypothetical protein [Kitasatospora]|uniref:Deoxyxylulose-5-phosphate synthase n=1 Tax=Kitasatospora setae (strain ATCC 33774 / DSM 43861 / JCM 3304 / KCC A-0304 / NBRC 14216 / KM-6054) TaxID=452652 RepID=E4N4B4_KITSK|nr:MULTISPECIES: hypothetical protein [Kitasatospora]BAJ26045.1 hypothetical protein KSE_01950 [Kitasatospora setae KM-6054]
MRFAPTAPARHHVCPPCRASYKRPAGGGALCPRCRGPLIDAGRHLRVPRRRDEAAWRALTALLRAGVRFPSYCQGAGWRPRTPREVRERLAASAGTGLPVAEALVTPELDALAELRRAARRVPERVPGPGAAGGAGRG